MIFFAVQKCINLIRSYLFICAFIYIALGDWTHWRVHWWFNEFNKKTLVWCRSGNVLPMISSRSFTVSWSIFKSLIQFEFVFCGVRMCFIFIDLHVAVQFFQDHLLKRLSLHHFILLPPLSKVRWTLGMWIYFWTVYSVLLIQMSVSVPVPYCFDYCNFLSIVWSLGGLCL